MWEIKNRRKGSSRGNQRNLKGEKRTRTMEGKTLRLLSIFFFFFVEESSGIFMKKGIQVRMPNCNHF